MVSGNLLEAMVGPGKVSVGEAKGAKAQQKATLHALNEWGHGARAQRSARFAVDAGLEVQRRQALMSQRARGDGLAPRTNLIRVDAGWE